MPSMDSPDIKSLMKDKNSILRAQEEDQILREVKEWVKEGERPKLQVNWAPP